MLTFFKLKMSLCSRVLSLTVTNLGLDLVIKVKILCYFLLEILRIWQKLPF